MFRYDERNPPIQSILVKIQTFFFFYILVREIHFNKLKLVD